ncbi:hypothetical protein [Streptomyces sp. NPDC050564]|uniref:hypothetical protein n=1 Tax=Streptomyces sp. NPDC050564 TaxID=3365631 RepID=UPI0037945043
MTHRISADRRPQTADRRPQTADRRAGLADLYVAADSVQLGLRRVGPAALVGGGEQDRGLPGVEVGGDQLRVARLRAIT